MNTLFTPEHIASQSNFKDGLDLLAPIQVEAEHDDNELHHHPVDYTGPLPRNYPIALAGKMYLFIDRLGLGYVVRLDENDTILWMGPTEEYDDTLLKYDNEIGFSYWTEELDFFLNHVADSMQDTDAA